MWIANGRLFLSVSSLSSFVAVFFIIHYKDIILLSLNFFQGNFSVLTMTTMARINFIFCF